MSSNCDRAKQLANKLPADVAGDLVAKCCGGSSADCLEKLSAAAATTYCLSQTGGSCPPCCSFVANKAAKALMYGLEKVGLKGVVADYWELGTGIVGMFIPDGSCNFDPNLAEAVGKARQYARAKALALSDTWVDLHNELGIQIPSEARTQQLVRVHFTLSPYRDTALLWLLLWGSEPRFSQDIKTTLHWEQLLINRAIQDGYHKRYSAADSSWGILWANAVPSPEQDKTVGIDQFLDIGKRYWKCDKASDFQDALAIALNFRLKRIDKAYDQLLKEMAVLMSERAQQIVDSQKQPTVRPDTDQSSVSFAENKLFASTAVDVLAEQRKQRNIRIALAVALAAGFGGYILYQRQR